MSNEWRAIDGEKWRDVVRRVVDIYNSKHLEEWEVMGQIAYEFEKVVAEKDAEIERLRKALEQTAEMLAIDECGDIVSDLIFMTPKQAPELAAYLRERDAKEEAV